MAKPKKLKFDSRYPSVEDLRAKAKKRIPKFAFEYLDGGCNEDVTYIKTLPRFEKSNCYPITLSEHTQSKM